MVGTWNSKHLYISRLELKVTECLCARHCVGHFCIILSFDAYYKPCKLDGISTYSRGAVAERRSESAVELRLFTWGTESRRYPHCAHICRLCLVWFQCLPRLPLCTWPCPVTWISGVRPALLCPSSTHWSSHSISCANLPRLDRTAAAFILCCPPGVVPV